MSGEHFSFGNHSFAHHALDEIGGIVKKDVMKGISGDFPEERALISEICCSLAKITHAMAYDAAEDRQMEQFQDCDRYLCDIQDLIHRYFKDRSLKENQQALAKETFLKRLNLTPGFSKIDNRIVPLEQYYSFLIALKGGYKNEFYDKEITSRKIDPLNWLKITIDDSIVCSNLDYFFGFMEGLEELGYKAFGEFQLICDSYINSVFATL